MENLLGIAVGIGLSAACGFRVFVPLLVMNILALSGHLHLSPGFAWIGSPYATAAFATATIVEVLSYSIPWLDHALDVVATPAAVVAGSVVTASMVTHLSPFFTWTLALIAGGGMAGLVQGVTSALRVKSLVATAGAANPVISALEAGGSLLVAFLAVFVPLLTLLLLGVILVLVFRKVKRVFFGRQKTAGPKA